MLEVMRMHVSASVDPDASPRRVVDHHDVIAQENAHDAG